MHLRHATILCLAWSIFLAGASTAQNATESHSAVADDGQLAAADAAPITTPLHPLGEALKDKLAADSKKGNDVVRADRAVLSEYYTARKYKLVWSDRDGLNPRAKAAIVLNRPDRQAWRMRR